MLYAYRVYDGKGCYFAVSARNMREAINTAKAVSRSLGRRDDWKAHRVQKLSRLLFRDLKVRN